VGKVFGGDARKFFFCVSALAFCSFCSYSHSFAGELRLSAHVVSVLNRDGSFVVVQMLVFCSFLFVFECCSHSVCSFFAAFECSVVFDFFHSPMH